MRILFMHIHEKVRIKIIMHIFDDIKVCMHMRTYT